MAVPHESHRPATVVPYTDGPYLLSGPFRLLDERGNPIEVRRRVVALCRCGRSRVKPFCDGTHKLVKFRADSAPAPSCPATGAAAPVQSKP
jgi:CDGSH-type Zn-finger protein